MKLMPAPRSFSAVGLKFLTKILVVGIIIVLPLLLWLVPQKVNQPSNAALCTFQVTSQILMTNTDVNVVIHFAMSFTEYLVVVSGPANNNKIYNSLGTPDGADYNIVIPGTFFPYPGNYSITIGELPSGSHCGGSGTVVTVNPPPPCALFLNTPNPTANNPVEIRIGLAKSFTDYLIVIDGPVQNQQIYNSLGTPNGGDFIISLPGSFFPQQGNYLIFAGTVSGTACNYSPLSITVGAPPPPPPDPNAPQCWNGSRGIVEAGKKVTIYGKNIVPSDEVFKKVFLKPTQPPGNEYWFGDSYIQGYPDSKADVKIPSNTPEGKYILRVETYPDNEHIDCPPEFTVEGNPPEVPGSNPCTPGGGCDTALGRIQATLSGFGSKILSVAIGLAGGLALILMVIGAVRVLTSQGDPQKLAGGREIIVGALAGLLFLIFSTLILRFIGVEIIGL